VNPILHVSQLCKSFTQGDKDVQVLTRINMEVSAGEKIAILGQSGSGKSTLLSLLGGLDNPDSGTIHISGVNLAEMSEDERSKTRSQKLGIVFQQYHLMRNLTAVENVGLPLEILNTPNHRELAHKAIAEVGLSHRTSHFPSEMSGGECQRIAIARAMVTQPSLILADEPSGNLDKKTGEEVMNLLFNLCTEHQTTLLLVTHNHELAKRCDRTMQLTGGVLNELNR
jgi:putative ABC transport system ATP-binding protein